jgi:type I restriction enzyme S subunit
MVLELRRGFFLSFSLSDTPHYQQDVPFKVPDNWVWATIEEICSKIGSGSTPRGSNYAVEGIPFFRSQNVYNDRLVYDDIKYISDETHQKMKGTEVLANDLLLNITGGSLGRCAVVPADFNRGNVSQHVCIMRPILIEPEYFHALILSSYFSKSMKITGSGREGLPKYSLEQMTFPLPPFAEQHRIVAEIERWFSLINIIENDKYDLQTTIKQVKSKILDLAIHGKLVPQDPNDEPAIELLKRINPDFTPCDNGHYAQLPQGWYYSTIKDIFIINPKIKADDNIEAGFVPMANITDGYNNIFKYETKRWGKIKTGFTHFADGDIAVAKISPCLENRKSVVLKGLPNGIGAGTTELHIFRPQLIDVQFGLYFFKSEHFINQCVGSFNGVVGQQRVSKNIIENMIIAIPPINEQKRIVCAVHEIFAKLDVIMESL